MKTIIVLIFFVGLLNAAASDQTARWSNRVITWGLHENLRPIESDLKEQVKKINKMKRLPIYLQYIGTFDEDTPPEQNGDITLFFTDEPGEPAGRTRILKNAKTGQIIAANIKINAAALNRLGQDSNRLNGYINTCFHEMIHGLGVGHLECPSLMCARLSTDKLYFTKRDKAALIKLYE